VRLQRRLLADPPTVCTPPAPVGFWRLTLTCVRCWDEPSCTERFATDHFDMSSADWKPLFAQEGIFGTDPQTNPFAGFNQIFVKAR